jgi:nucleoside-diphosphate-sugar epimerase
MRIIITGNMGYVGPVVAAHFRRTWPDAMLGGIDQGWFAHCLFGLGALPETVLDFQVFRDVRDISAADLTGADAVIHLAAVSNDAMGKRFESVTDEINHRASVSVAKAASEAGVGHFVFASSCSVYGAAADGAARSETSSLAPLTAYARSKIDTEKDLAALDTDMIITSLRFATACGLSPRLRLDLVLNDFVASAVSTGTIEILSDGSPWRPLIHVRDMARAMEWAATRPADQGGRYLAVNGGCDEWNFQVRDLATAVGKAMPEADISMSKTPPADNRSYKVDFAKFRSLAPNHQPRETLGGAIAELRDAMKAINFSDRNFRNSDFIRLKILNGLVDQGKLASDLRQMVAA